MYDEFDDNELLLDDFISVDDNLIKKEKAKEQCPYCLKFICNKKRLNNHIESKHPTMEKIKVGKYERRVNNEDNEVVIYKKANISSDEDTFNSLINGLIKYEQHLRDIFANATVADINKGIFQQLNNFEKLNPDQIKEIVNQKYKLYVDKHEADVKQINDMLAVHKEHCALSSLPFTATKNHFDEVKKGIKDGKYDINYLKALKSHHETLALWVDNEIYNFSVETDDLVYGMIETIKNHYDEVANTIDI